MEDKNHLTARECRDLAQDAYNRSVESLRISQLQNVVNAVTNELRSETAKRKALEKTVETRGDMICEQMETVSLLTERYEKFWAHIKELGNGDPGTVKEREGQIEQRDKEIAILRRDVAEQGDMLTEYEDRIEECHKKIKRQADHIKCQDSKLTRLNKTAKNNSPWGRVVKDLKEKISQHENHIADQGDEIAASWERVNKLLNGLNSIWALVTNDSMPGTKTRTILDISNRLLRPYK